MNMKTRLFSFFLALAASVGTISASAIKVDDNSLEDWKNLPADYVFESVCPEGATLLGLKSVKVYADLDYINILVEPNMDDITDLEYVPFHIYINADNSDATGGYGDEFTDPNTDICLEGGVFSGNEPSSYNPYVFKWWGEIGGFGWEWTDPNVSHDQSDCWGAIICEGQFPGSASQFVDGKIEIQFAYHNIPVTWNETEFGIGFDIQQNWESAGILPLVSPTDENPNGHAHKLQVKINPVSGLHVIVDGIAYDFDATSHTCTVVYNRETGYSGNLAIPSNVTYKNETYTVVGIAESAFEGCTGLTGITIPNSVTSIGQSAFYGCSSLTSIDIPNSVTSIGDYVFYGCSSLTSVTIGNSVTSIGGYAFVQCSSLTSVTIPNSVTSIGEAAFGNCSSLPSVTIPNSVTSIGDYAFMYCSSLTSVTIPNSVTSIGWSAFMHCSSLTSVTIPNSVTSIRWWAFYGCSSLKKIVNYAITPQAISSDEFSGDEYYPAVDKSTCKLYVPKESVDLYNAADGWKEFENILPIAAEGVETESTTVETSETTAEITWPEVSGAYTYELIIRDKNGNLVCTLIFNANGQLTQITFGAPARDHSTQSSGFSFTVTGLDSGTSYDLTITAKDENGAVLQTTTQSFTTAGGASAVDNVPTGDTRLRKMLINGQLLIIKNGRTYNATGAEVK